MKTSRANRWMNLASLGFLSAATGIGVWCWNSNVNRDSLLESTDATSFATAKRSIDAVATPASTDNLASDNSLWTRPLRSGFKPAMPNAPVANTPLVPIIAPNPIPTATHMSAPIGLRLVGVVIEDGNSMAIAIDQQGKLDFRKEGESFQLIPEGVKVQTVLADSILVSFRGQRSTWRLGESLSMPTLHTTEMPPTSPSASPSVPALSEEISQPPMSLEEELDRLNGTVPGDQL